MEFKNANELLALCQQEGCPISEIMRRRECILGETTVDAVTRRMSRVLEIMRESATIPLTSPIRSIAVPLPREGQTLLTRDGLRFRLYAGPGWRAAVCGRSEPPPSILWRDIPPKGGGPVDL